MAAVPEGIVMLPKAQKGEVFGMGFDLGEKDSPQEAQEEIPDSGMSVKICILGDKAVGKTSLQSFAVGLPFSGAHKTTNKFITKRKHLKTENLDLVVELSDPPSDCSFARLTEFLFDCDGVYIAFDLSSLSSFQKVQEYQEQITLALQSDSFPIILVGLKADLVNERQVSAEEAKGLAKKFGIYYLEVSAKCDDCFERHLKKMAKTVLTYYMPQQKKACTIL